MSITMRVAKPDDENSVIGVWRACGLIAAYNDPALDFRFALAGAASTILVATSAEGDIIGTVMVGHDGHRGWLYYVACAPEHRGLGIGRALVQAGEDWLRTRHVNKVQLMVRETNKAVAQFYEQLGYEDMPRILMSKWLND